ncbi:MAG: glyoxalase [Flavobacterium sp.]
MTPKVISIRPFIGSKNFETSRSFYRDLGFEENELGPGFSVFHFHHLSFYLQDYYAEEWVGNTMVFMEVENTEEFWAYLQSLNLTEKYPESKLVPPRTLPWGSECFVHDPAGVLWHFGAFNPE